MYIYIVEKIWTQFFSHYALKIQSEKLDLEFSIQYGHDHLVLLLFRFSTIDSTVWIPSSLIPKYYVILPTEYVVLNQKFCAE